MLIGGIFLVLMALMGWVLLTVSLNTGRISVLENRADANDRMMWEIKDDLKVHRQATERSR